MFEEGLNREEKLLIWMRRNGLSYAALGKLLAITRMSALRLCKAPRINSMRHGQLSQLGIPYDLLPTLEDRPRGRRPCKICA
jgi:hypothetical protein